MSKSINTRTRYKLVGSDYSQRKSAQEPRLTAHMADDPAMKQAYAEGKDLYCVIASKVFNNDYWDNTEFYREGTIVELDGKQTVAGSGQEHEKCVTDALEVPYYYLVPTIRGDIVASELKSGDSVVAKEGNFVISHVIRDGDNIRAYFEN